jgi:lysozyme family protein
MSKISERGNFMANDFDKEYYVMNVDRANNHPLLSWGETAYDALRKKEIIDENTLTVPLRLIFGEPYPD